jgi:hypothetical protein
MAIELDEDGLLWRQLDDGRLLALVPLTFNRLRLTIGYDRLCYEDGW